ncbi:MAG: DUF4760 domain-containing protein [Nitrospinae bacterium]|nr:DUF4760 domain-containing protein [Nitrospinota bacterium]
MSRDFSKAFDFNLKLERRFTVHIGLVAIIFVGVIVGVYFFLPAHKELATFIAIAVGAASAIVSAFYIAQSVYANVESEQMTRTMSLTSEWNTASFFDSKKAVIGLIKPIAAKPREERLKIIQEEIKDNEILELNITNVLNYLEDLAVLVDKGFVDEETIRELFQTNGLRYYDVFEPWIADLRNRRGNRLYQGLENLCRKWNNSIS